MNEQALCETCEEKTFLFEVGVCGACRGPTTSSAFELCRECARKREVCMACGSSEPQKPETD